MPAPVSLPQRVLRPSGRRVRALKRTTPSAGLGHMDVRAWLTSAHQPSVSASVGIRQRSSGWLRRLGSPMPHLPRDRAHLRSESLRECGVSTLMRCGPWVGTRRRGSACAERGWAPPLRSRSVRAPPLVASRRVQARRCAALRHAPKRPLFVCLLACLSCGSGEESWRDLERRNVTWLEGMTIGCGGGGACRRPRPSRRT